MFVSHLIETCFETVSHWFKIFAAGKQSKAEVDSRKDRIPPSNAKKTPSQATKTTRTPRRNRR